MTVERGRGDGRRTLPYPAGRVGLDRSQRSPAFLLACASSPPARHSHLIPLPPDLQQVSSYILSSRTSTRMTLRRPLGVLQLKTDFPRPPGDVVRASSCAAFPSSR